MIYKEICWECAVTGKQSVLLGNQVKFLLHPSTLLLIKCMIIINLNLFKCTMSCTGVFAKGFISMTVNMDSVAKAEKNVYIHIRAVLK